MNKHLWIWHRRLGAAVAVVVIALCITGIALNHTEALRLDERYIAAGWLLDWYGIGVPDTAVSVETAEHEVTLFGDHLYVDGTFIGAPYSKLHGAAATDDYLAIAAGDELLLLTRELELVERLGPADGLPVDLRLLATTRAGDFIARDGNGTVWATDADLITWRALAPAGDVPWPHARPAGQDRVAALTVDFRGRILTAEKLMLDLHSGRLFGRYGPWLMDGVALTVLVLSFSGLWLWTRTRS